MPPYLAPRVICVKMDMMTTDHAPAEQGDVSAAYCDTDAFSIQAQGHDFTFFPAGSQRLQALVDHIDGAQQSLELFYYMFQEDAAGEKVRAALVRAAQRGVQLHLIVDAFGTDAPDEFFQPIVDAGGRFNVFSPRWNVRYLIRNHQKFVIADRSRVLTGGFNVSEHYFAPPADNGWCDLGALIEGPVVESFIAWFAQLQAWVGNRHRQFRAIRAMVRDWDPGSGPVQLLLGGPTRMTSAWAQAIKRDLNCSSRLDLVMAYFSPPKAMRRLLAKIARKGQTRLIMAGKSDNQSTIGAARSLYSNLLRSGAEIYEFQPCKLHMKMLVVDDVTYFGSGNFDMRSIRLNLELMVRVEDAGLAAKMRELVDNMQAGSEHITPQLHKSRKTMLNIIRWRLGWFLVSVLDYTVTRRLNLGA